LPISPSFSPDTGQVVSLSGIGGVFLSSAVAVIVAKAISAAPVITSLWNRFSDFIVFSSIVTQTLRRNSSTPPPPKPRNYFGHVPVGNGLGITYPAKLARNTCMPRVGVGLASESRQGKDRPGKTIVSGISDSGWIDRKGLDHFKALARKHGNCTLSLAPPHKNVYRDYSPRTVRRLEIQARKNLKAALIQNEIPVVLSTDAETRTSISTNYLELESERGNVSRFTIKKDRWIDENWQMFTGPFEFGTRRDIHLFLQFNAKSLATLVSKWYDPNVLTKLLF
jgi:hypothetical protein